jgi:hypothetical protein
MNKQLLKYLIGNQVKCWYPCSGFDFGATKLFERTSKIPLPQLYVFTDNEIYKTSSEEILNLTKFHGFEFIENFELEPSPSVLKFDKNDPNQQSRLNMHYIKQMRLSDPLSSELMEMGLGDAEENYFDLLDFNTKKSIIYDECKPSAFQVYKNEEIILLLINCENEWFYNFCIQNQIVLNSTINIRSDMDQFIFINLLKILKNLEIKNGFFYLNQINETARAFLIQNQQGNSFNYNRNYNDNEPVDQLIFSNWE